MKALEQVTQKLDFAEDSIYIGNFLKPFLPSVHLLQSVKVADHQNLGTWEEEVRRHLVRKRILGHFALNIHIAMKSNQIPEWKHFILRVGSAASIVLLFRTSSSWQEIKTIIHTMTK